MWSEGTNVKHASHRKMNQDMPLRPGLQLQAESTRIQGGNWKMQGFRRSGHVYDEAECQMSIAEFMAEHERYDNE
jgi:hypothetical protein